MAAVMELNSNGCPCKENGINGSNGDYEKLITFEDFPKFDETQEILFPPSLIVEKSVSDLFLEGTRVKLVAPVSWKLFDDCFQEAARSQKLPARWVSVHNLPLMGTVEVNEDEVSIGAAVNITDFVKSLEKYCDRSISTPIRKLFDKYSSMQVMNVATWVGGLFTGASDTLSLFMAFNPKLVVRELGGAFTSAQFSDFMDDQGRIKLKRGAAVVATIFPRSQ
ncbi:FAD binding domain in molybdopterin dehydrogenase, partial [Cooperia oncophora]